MRKLIVSILALIATITGITTANAVSFDAQDFSPEYTTGITELTLTTDQGNFSTVPVWSMEACEFEDGSGQIACVWHAPSQGNGMGAVSFIKLGGEQTATISNEAAGILLLQGTLPLVDYSTAPVLTEPVQVAPIVETAPIENEVVQEEYVAPETEVMTEDPAGLDEVIEDIHSTSKFDACVQEDGSGQPGEQDCIWVSSKMGNKNGDVSVIWHQGENGPYGEFLTNEQAEARVN